MPDERTIVIGAGQAGLATSYWLTQRGIAHLILERGRVADAWRHARWDSFCLVTPNWTITLPGAAYSGTEPGGFMPRDAYVTHLEDWARRFAAPVREGVAVHRLSGRPGAFRLETSQGSFEASNVIVATSTYQSPRRPAAARQAPARVEQLNASEYRHPAALRPGAVLVVGSGQTGCQLAEEIHEAGRATYLCVGKAGRLPRRYRGRDCIEWQRDMGYLDRTPQMLEDPAHRFRGDPHLSGKNGGRTLSLHIFHRAGIVLLGGLRGFDGTRALLAPDLHEKLEGADAFARNLMAQMDRYILQAGIVAPPPSAAELEGEPAAGWSVPVIASLDLEAAGITTIIWATGFDFDFSWIEFPVFDVARYPRTARGVTEIPGLYFMGLNWMHKRKSGIIYGVGEDAAWVVEHIARRR